MTLFYIGSFGIVSSRSMVHVMVEHELKPFRHIQGSIFFYIGLAKLVKLGLKLK